MDFFVWQRTIVNEEGRILPNASVSVTDVASGALAQLYSDEGVTGIGNPITADSSGFAQFYVKSGIYDIVASLGSDSRTWSDEAIGSPKKKTPAENSAGVTPVDLSFDEGWVDRYSPNTTPGTTVMVAALQAAVDVIKAKGGGRISFVNGQRYNLGTFGVSSASIITCTDLKNAIFDFNGAELFLTVTNNSADQVMINLLDPVNITFNQPRFIASGNVAPFSELGPKAVWLRVSDSASTEVGNVVFNQPYWEGLTTSVSVFRTAESVTRRFRNIRIYGGQIESGYYGPNFQQAGDDFEGDWTCHNIRRAYFPYGVRRHRARVSVCNDLANFTADACINIATQPQAGNTAAPVATQDIHVDATFRGDVISWSSGGLIVFYHVGATTPQTIKDCSAFLNVTGVSNLSALLGSGILFKSHGSAGGAEETTTTDNIWNGIRVDALCSEYQLAATTTGLLSFNVAPTTLSSVFLGPGIRAAFQWLDTASAASQKLTNWQFHTSGREFVQFKTGDLTSGSLAIDLSELDVRQFTLKLKIWAKSQRNGSGQDVTYREILVTGFNAGGGAVGISQQDTLFTHSTGTASAFTVAASGETLTVSFTNYSNSEAWASVAVEHIWPVVSITL